MPLFNLVLMEARICDWTQRKNSHKALHALFEKKLAAREQSDPAYGRSHLRPTPLTADPTYGRSHLRPIPLTADPAYGRSHLKPIPLTADPT